MRAAVVAVVLLGASAGTSAVARADASATATVTLTPAGQALATQLGETPQQLQAQIQNQVDAAYQTTNINQFLRDFVDATSFSNRGLGVDYASASDDFMLGIAGNVAVSSPSAFADENHPTGGGAVNAAGMLGFSLKGVGLPRAMIFMNGFYQGESTNQLSGHLTSGGAHVQIRLIKPQDDVGAAVVARWIGLDLTTGGEFTKWTLGIKDTLTDVYTVGSGTGQALTVVSNGQFTLSSQVITVPIELTTGVRLAELFSIYAGGGIDFAVGKSTIDADLDGTAKASNGTAVADVKITGSGSNTGSPAAWRVLAGAQLNLWRIKVFAQGNLSQNSTASVSFGLRVLL